MLDSPPQGNRNAQHPVLSARSVSLSAGADGHSISQEIAINRSTTEETDQWRRTVPIQRLAHPRGGEINGANSVAISSLLNKEFNLD